MLDSLEKGGFVFLAKQGGDVTRLEPLKRSALAIGGWTSVAWQKLGVMNFKEIYCGMLEGVLAFFYPPVCQICGTNRAMPEQGYVCLACVSKPGALRFIETGYCSRCGIPYDGAVERRFACSNCAGLNLEFDWARSSVVATPFVLDLARRYKYHGATWLQPLLKTWLLRVALVELDGTDWDWIVPVPMHNVRLRERGYNQAERLGVGLSFGTGITLNTKLLRRVKATPTQTTLNRRERMHNMADAFAVLPKAVIRGKRVLIVDDVLTTGATTSGCAKVLRRAGALSEGVWTLARGK